MYHVFLCQYLGKNDAINRQVSGTIRYLLYFDLKTYNCLFFVTNF